MMTTAKLITSGKQFQIADLAAVATRKAAVSAIENIVLDDTTTQTKIIECGDKFQSIIQPQMETIIADALNRLSGRKHPMAEEIEKYFREVYGYTLDLVGVTFPEKSGLTTYMAVPVVLNEDEIMTKLANYFQVKSYAWKSPIASNIDRGVEQKRPQGLYIFAHRGGDEPDQEHLGKSYDDAMGEGLKFLNPREYLYATGFHMWKHHKWMDVKGWTRTSSLWSDGRLVGGGWSPASGRLCLYRGGRGHRLPDDGPRELFLG